MKNRKRILVAPLDWGLGHASRCIPIIREILALGHEPVLASDGRALELLKTEFPQLQCITLPGYHPVYPKGSNMVFTMAWQVPKFLSAIQQEHVLLKKICREQAIDLVISDNRYGLWSADTPTVLITHQLFIQMPAAMQWMQPAVNALNHFFIKKFHYCWVPDVPDQNENLSGILSHDNGVPANVKYIGMLSRFTPSQLETKYDLLALLSGPEPQRTILEKEILRQIKELNIRALLVRGITEENKRDQLTSRVESVSCLSSNEINQALLQSAAVICRSGYSSIMDLASLQKGAILIPTPGQTEQEYLAERLSSSGAFVMQHQHALDLKASLARSKALRHHKIPFEGTLFRQALRKFIEAQG